MKISSPQQKIHTLTIIFILILSFILINPIGIIKIQPATGRTLQPHPIYGWAEYCNGGDANGAYVEVTSTLGTKTTYVGPAGGWESGAWSVEVGYFDPWPEGTNFTVTITNNTTGWTATANGTVSGDYNNMGTLYLEPTYFEAIATANTTIALIGTPVQFNGSTNGGAPPFSWYWDFDDNTSAVGRNTTHSYSSLGIFHVTLTVSDSCGNTDVDHLNITVISGLNLTADAGGPYTGTICSPVQFSGTASGGIPPYNFTWDFGDGINGTGQNPAHQYDTDGAYMVTLTVTDYANTTYNSTTQAIISTDILQADPGGPYSGTICTPIQFNGSATGGCGPYTFFWDFGDGVTGMGPNITHQYESDGTYIVTLTVTDDIGNTDIGSTQAIISTEELEANPGGPYNGTICTPIQFTGSATGGCPPYNYEWDFGDEGTSTQQNPSHQYNKDGIYTVTLVVTDSDGGISINTTTVNISTSDVTADAGGPYKGNLTDYIQFHGTASGGCTPYSWEWDFGDGNTSTTQNPRHLYSKEGKYTVTLIVTDAKGKSSTDTTTARITNDTVVDDTPPTVEIIKPGRAIYLYNTKVLPFFPTIIIGGIDVIVEASDDLSGMEKVIFSLDETEKYTDEVPSNDLYIWTWNEQTFGRYTLKATAFDKAGNSATDEITVWRFF